MAAAQPAFAAMWARSVTRMRSSPRPFISLRCHLHLATAALQMEQHLIGSATSPAYLEISDVGAQQKSGASKSNCSNDGLLQSIRLPTETDACPICLSTITDLALLEPCKHKFCSHCILQWAQMPQSHPSHKGACYRLVPCPLCRLDSANMVHDIVAGTFCRYYFDPHIKKPFVLGAHHQRLVVYRENLHAKVREAFMAPKRKRQETLVVPKISSLTPSLRAALKQWVKREFQALRQEEDVHMHVDRVVRLLERSEKRQKSAFPFGVLKTSWKKEMVDHVKDFIYVDPQQFCEELETFLLAEYIMSPYDDVVEKIIEDHQESTTVSDAYKPTES